MENLSLREIQLEELEILKKLTRYLDEKGITYYLSSRTLLGAIRHKGFIPWDDDVDIEIPRPDYEKLMKIVNTKEIDLNYEFVAFERDGQGVSFCKVINKNIHVESKSIKDKFLWIDIFPLDGLPDDRGECKRIIKQLLFLKGQIYLKNTKVKEIWKEKRTLFNRLLKIVLKPIASRHSLKYYYSKMLAIARQYDYDTSENVGVLTWPDGEQSIYKKKWFEKTAEVEFENERFKAPKQWHEYLKCLYGDYMIIPPKEKQTDHKIKAKKIGEAK